MTTIEYLRQFRVLGFAVFDFTAAVLGMLLLSPLLSWLFAKIGILVPKRNWVISMLPLSVVFHLLFGTMTPFTKDILDPSGHLMEKLLVLICCVFSVLGVRRLPKVTTRASVS
jgi:hypothetical protein